MANLRAFQNVSQPQGARLQQIPVAPPAPSAAAGIAAVGSMLTPLVAEGLKVNQANQKVAAQEAEGLALTALNDRLIAAQQAGQTDPKFNTATAQRKIFKEFAAENPQYSQSGLKVFNDATGLKVAGMSVEEEQRIAIQNEAWKEGFGHPSMGDEFNQRELERYMQIQRDGHELDYQAKKLANQEAQGRINKQTAKTEVLKTLQKVSFTSFDSTNDKVNQLMVAVENGEMSREAALAEMRMTKVRFGQQMNSFGEMKNDPDVVALVSPQIQLFDLAIEELSKDKEMDDLRRKKEQLVLKQEVAILTDPKNAHAVATSGLFGHAPGTSGFVSQIVSEIYSEGPADITNLQGEDTEEFRVTLDSMLVDPKTATEAATFHKKINTHFVRNGEDYTDEQKFEVLKVLNQPKVWSLLPQSDKDAVVNGLEVHMTDVVQKTLRDAENTTVPVPDFSGAATSTSGIGGATRMAPITEYAEIAVDANGVRYTLINQNAPRQVRMKIIEVNKQLAQRVNPTFSILGGATNTSTETIATRFIFDNVEENNVTDEVTETEE